MRLSFFVGKLLFGEDCGAPQRAYGCPRAGGVPFQFQSVLATGAVRRPSWLPKHLFDPKSFLCLLPAISASP